MCINTNDTYSDIVKFVNETRPWTDCDEFIKNCYVYVNDDLLCTYTELYGTDNLYDEILEKYFDSTLRKTKLYAELICRIESLEDKINHMQSTL